MYEQEVVSMVHPTLCEVIYHGNEERNVFDEVYTPYRLRGTSGQTSRPILYGAPSYTDPASAEHRNSSCFMSPNRIPTSLSLYSANTIAPSKPATVFHGDCYQETCPDWAYSPDLEKSYSQRKERAKTAPCTTKSLPTLLSQRHAAESRRGIGGRAVTSLLPSENSVSQKVKWIPALNAWIPEKQNPSQYLSFVNALTLGNPNADLNLEVEGHELPVLPCSRFLSHMHVHEDQIKALYAEKNAKLESQRIARENRRAEMLTKRKTPTKQVIKVQQPSPSSPSVPPPPSKPPSAPIPLSGSSKTIASSPKLPSSPAQIPEQKETDNEKDEVSKTTDEKQTDSDGEDVANIEKVSVSTQENLDEQLLSNVSDNEPSSSPTPLLLEPLPASPTPQIHISLLPPHPKAKSPISSPKTDTSVSQKAKPTKPPKSTKKPTGKQQSKKKPKTSKNTDASTKAIIDVAPQTEIQKTQQEESKDIIQSITKRPETQTVPVTEEPKPVSGIPPNPLQKRVRWRAQPQKKDSKSHDSENNNSADSWKRRDDGWIFGDDDYSTSAKQEPPQTEEQETGSPSPLPDLSGPATENNPESTPKRQPTAQTIIPDWVKKKYSRKKRDPEWEEEQRRRRLAAERREKALEMYERLRKKRYAQDEDVDLSDAPRFEDYGWLAQYCIFQRNSLELFKRTFEAVDDQHKGFLGPVDTILALRAINNKLSLAEEEYLYRIMELAGYKLSAGTDFKLYALMAALSQRIAGLDDWMKHLIGQMDFSTLERKLFMCKTLWECNVDPETNTISIDQLCVELRAGGVSFEHEQEVREKLGHLGSLDLLDFMSYVPLFIMIHTSVVHNPLDDTREK